jgi:L-alanine-DL-glutamate epimerase-like enolase superfamily enzyme
LSAPQLTVAIERWPIAGSFTISRGSKTEAVVVTAILSQGRHVGRGECVPYARYGETVEGVAAEIEALAGDIADGLDRNTLQTALAPGAARNALDCAFWDLEAKLSNRRVWELIGRPAPDGLTTAYTLSVGTPEAMGEAAGKSRDRPLLKVKLAGRNETGSDDDRIRAVRAAAPDTELIIDANEAWSREDLPVFLEACAAAGVSLIEQPLPAGNDALLAEIERPVPVCADESAHDLAGLPELLGRYDAINIKLDKTGGLTEALALADAANRAGLKIMVGCMLATSLAMAPAMVVAQDADFVDLDGPLLLAKDRDPGLAFAGSQMSAPQSALWG